MVAQKRDRNFGVFLFFIFVFSAAVLCLEVALSFEYAFLFWFYLSFIIIAVAMFGIGVGSVLGYYLNKRYPSGYYHILGYSSLGMAISILFLLALFYLIGRVPSVPKDLSAGLLLYSGGFMLTGGLPFVFVGMFLSTSLNYPGIGRRTVSYIYFADLLGAGVGAFMITPLLPILGVEGVMAFCGLLSIAVSVYFNPRRKHAVIAGFMTLILVGMIFTGGSFINTPPGGKYLSQVLEKDGILLDTRWTPVSRVDVIELPSGLRRFVENAEYPITISRGEINPQGSRKDPRWAMFYRKPSSMLAIGSGGGVEVIMGLSEGVKSLDAVEINPFIIDYMRNELGEYSDHLYDRPEVRVFIEDGRTFVHREGREYDLIENGVLGSAGLVVPSTSMLTTKDMNVYTAEAQRQYFRRLSEDGLAVTIIYGLLDDYNVIDRERGITAITLKQYETLKEALKGEGVDPSRHFAIFRFVQKAGNYQDEMAQAEYTFLFRKELDPEASEELLKVARGFGLEPIYLPNYAGSIDLETVIDSLPPSRDVSPALDDRPFFYYTDDRVGQILILAGIALFILAMLFILLPLGLWQKVNLRGSMDMIGYFLLIGIAFILVEAVMIQKLTLFLGRPSYAFQVVLSAMLIFSGLGSLSSGLYQEDDSDTKRVLLPLFIIGLALLVVSINLQGLVFSFIDNGLGVKILISVLLVGPLAFVMGMPFPLGLRLVGSRRSENIIWMYGVNSIGSVMASVIGMYMSLVHGLSASLRFGGILYLMAFLIILNKSWRRL